MRTAARIALLSSLLLTGPLFAGAQPVSADAAPDDAFRLSDLLPRAFQKNPRVTMTVITEYTAAGRKSPSASPAHPVSYFAGDAGYHVAGQTIAGEVLPAPEILHAALEKALARNDYVPVAQGQAPALILICYWGAANPRDSDIPDIGHRELLARAALVGGSAFAGRYARVLAEEDDMRDLGGMPAALDPLTRFEEDPRTRSLVQQARGNSYFLIALAYDFNALAHGRHTLLWRTKMTVTSDGVTLAGTLPALIASASPYLGREMTGPVLLDRHLDHYGNGSVSIGPARVTGYDDPQPLPAEAYSHH